MDESSFEIFSVFEIPGVKINDNFGVYVKFLKLFFNLKGVSVFKPNIDQKLIITK